MQLAQKHERHMNLPRCNLFQCEKHKKSISIDILLELYRTRIGAFCYVSEHAWSQAYCLFSLGALFPVVFSSLIPGKGGGDKNGNKKR